MKKKLMVLTMALGLSVAVLTGCGKPTVESLVDGMYDQEIESSTVEMDMDMVLSLTVQGMSTDISAGGNFEVQSSGLTDEDAMSNYIDGTLNFKAEVAGMDESLGFEMYMLTDDDTMTYYVNIDDADEWYKTELDMTDLGDVDISMDQDTTDAVNEAMKDYLKENAELAEETEDVEGEECYVLTATIDGDGFQEIYEPMGDMFDEMNDMMKDAGLDIEMDIASYLSYFTMDVTYYISKDTGYQVKSEVDLSGSDLYGMVEQVVADTGLDELGIMDQLQDISFSKCSFSSVMSDINETEVEVPDDVIDNAVDMDEAGMVNDIMGGVGDTPIEPDPVDPVDPLEPPVEPDPVDPNEDEWFHGDSFTLNKCDEYDEFLCEVKIPDEYTYDDITSTPELGIVCLDRADGEGWIWVQNEVESPMYYALLNNGVLPVDEYPDLEEIEDYQCAIEVIGTAFGGRDVLLVAEAYTYNGSENGNVYLCIEYNDGGYKEFLSVDCNNMYDLDQWTEDDFLDLAVSLFGY